MSFQWAIDNAESIEIESRPVVAQTQARNGRIRAVSRGANLWQFTVRLPDGPRWSDVRADIARIEALGRTTQALIKFNNPGQSWFIPYQGTAANLANLRVTIPSSGNTITLTAGQASAGGFNFRAGDIIQLRTTGAVYRVTADVPAGTNVVPLHRPLIDAAGTNQVVRVGPAAEWRVRCVDQPRPRLFARDQVAWSGAFVFVEDFV
jgi:hypothetical protein